MNTIAIDTYKTITKLKAKGYTEEQAEGFIEALTESGLVTTPYFDEKVKEVNNSIKELELRMTIKFYSALFIHGLAVIATIFGIAKAL